ncbi:MAG: lipase family protein, partial [Spirochaeta sp.]
TGLTDACRTSREDEIGINWGLYQSHMMAHAGQGTIGILPDYMYFGDSSRLQPYFIPDAEARVLLDAVRATHSFFRDDNGLASAAGSLSNAVPSEGAVLAGFSQGGHAIFAAADRVRKYAPEVTIAGLIGYGPTTDIEQIFRDFTVVAAPIIYTYAQRYGTDRFNPEVMIRDRWLNNLEADVQRLCILGLQDYYPWGPDTFFQPAFLDALLNRRLETAFPEIHAILRENSTGLSGHGIPALILQGGNDVVISEADQTEFVLDLRDNSSDVRYIVYPDSRHDTRQIGFSEAQNWIIQRTISEE